VTLRFFLPLKPPGLNGPKGLMRMHYRERVRLTEVFDLAVLAALPSRNLIPGPVRVTYTVHYARQPRDPDNLAASLKFPLDAVVKAGVLEDDGPHVVAELVTRQIKVPRVKDEGCTLEIEQLSPEETS